MFTHSAKELALLAMSRRRELKLSQAKVGDLVGLRQKTISAFENNPENTQLSTLFRILSALGLDIKILAKDSTNKTSKQWAEEW